MFKNLTSIFVTLIIFVFIASCIVFGAYFKDKETFTDEETDEEKNENESKSSPDKSTPNPTTTNNPKKKINKRTDMIENVKQRLINDLDHMKASVESSIQSIITSLDIDTETDESDVSESEQLIISSKGSHVVDDTTTRNSQKSVRETADVIDDDIDESESGEEEKEIPANDNQEDAEEDIEEFENFMSFEPTKHSKPKKLNEFRTNKNERNKKQKKVNMSSVACQGITSPYCLHFSEL